MDVRQLLRLAGDNSALARKKVDRLSNKDGDDEETVSENAVAAYLEKTKKFKEKLAAEAEAARRRRVQSRLDESLLTRKEKKQREIDEAIAGKFLPGDKRSLDAQKQKEKIERQQLKEELQREQKRERKEREAEKEKVKLERQQIKEKREEREAKAKIEADKIKLREEEKMAKMNHGNIHRKEKHRTVEKYRTEEKHRTEEKYRTEEKPDKKTNIVKRTAAPGLSFADLAQLAKTNATSTRITQKGNIVKIRPAKAKVRDNKQDEKSKMKRNVVPEEPPPKVKRANEISHNDKKNEKLHNGYDEHKKKEKLQNGYDGHKKKEKLQNGYDDHKKKENLHNSYDEHKKKEKLHNSYYDEDKKKEKLHNSYDEHKKKEKLHNSYGADKKKEKLHNSYDDDKKKEKLHNGYGEDKKKEKLHNGYSEDKKKEKLHNVHGENIGKSKSSKLEMEVNKTNKIGKDKIQNDIYSHKHKNEDTHKDDLAKAKRLKEKGLIIENMVSKDIPVKCGLIAQTISTKKSGHIAPPDRISNVFKQVKPARATGIEAQYMSNKSFNKPKLKKSAKRTNNEDYEDARPTGIEAQYMKNSSHKPKLKKPVKRTNRDDYENEFEKEVQMLARKRKLFEMRRVTGNKDIQEEDLAVDGDYDYDSDTEDEDFIDDSEYCGDVSRHIKAITGYDRTVYDDSDMDDYNMESSYFQIEKEEARSARIGREEDRIEAMQEEQEQLALQKAMMKKKKNR